VSVFSSLKGKHLVLVYAGKHYWAEYSGHSDTTYILPSPISHWQTLSFQSHQPSRKQQGSVLMAYI